MALTNFCAAAAAWQADKEEIRSQLASATAELEAIKQQLSGADTARSQAEAAMNELQTLHDSLASEHAAVQAKVSSNGQKRSLVVVAEHTLSVHVPYTLAHLR